MANITWHYLTRDGQRQARGDAQDSCSSRTTTWPARKTSRCWRRFCRCATTSPTSSATRPGPITRPKSRWSRTPPRRIDFLEKLKTGLQPKFDAELAEFRQLKVKETGDANAQIHVWDWRYFSNQLKKEKYNVDAEQLRVYLPLPARARRHVRTSTSASSA